jgi:formate dehydrogenase major subunit
MGIGDKIRSWPVYRQLSGSDRSGRGQAARSPHTEALRSRVTAADEVVRSVCPYCAVGCGQRVYVKDGAVTQIEGDPDSPISRGRLCPKGAASLQLTTGPARRFGVLYRRPYGTDWERLDLDTAMDMIADRVIAARRDRWEWNDPAGEDADGAGGDAAGGDGAGGDGAGGGGARTRRTLGFASLGGATLDNEENYLIKKLFTALGAIQIENQARI